MKQGVLQRKVFGTLDLGWGSGRLSGAGRHKKVPLGHKGVFSNKTSTSLFLLTVILTWLNSLSSSPFSLLVLPFLHRFLRPVDYLLLTPLLSPHKLQQQLQPPDFFPASVPGPPAILAPVLLKRGFTYNLEPFLYLPWLGGIIFPRCVPVTGHLHRDWRSRPPCL